MDETALLAMGILFEEAAAEALGKTGDLALLEGDLDDGELLHNVQSRIEVDRVTRRSVINRSQPARKAARGRSPKAPKRGEGSKRSRSRVATELLPLPSSSPSHPMTSATRQPGTLR